MIHLTMWTGRSWRPGWRCFRTTGSTRSPDGDQRPDGGIARATDLPCRGYAIQDGAYPSDLRD